MKKKLVVTSPITWARFLGLLQTDGNFNFFVERDRTIRPKVTITITEKRGDFITDVESFLRREGFKPAVQRFAASDRGTNISIERIKECNKLFLKLKELENGNNGISLVGQKRLDFLILEQVLFFQGQTRTKEIKAQILDLKLKLSENKVGPKSLDIEESTNRIGLPKGFVVNGTAKTIINSLVTKKDQSSEKMVKLSQNFNLFDASYQNFGEFVSGVVDGDGSFQVSFKVHWNWKDEKKVLVSKKDGSTFFRRVFQVKPEMTLTDLKNTTDNNPLFQIFKNVFTFSEKKTNGVGEDVKAERLYITSLKDIKDQVVPFFEKYPPSFKRGLNRFKLMRLVVNNHQKLLKNKRYNLLLVKLIHSHPDFGWEFRNYTLEQYKYLIEKQFSKE